jgi:hypothetical protein
VYKPFASTIPHVADQETDVLIEFATIAMNCCVPFESTDVVIGARVIDIG